VVVAADLLDVVTEREAFTVLAHEWAHIENRDTWIGVLQRATQTLYWWLPPVHAMGRQLSLSREMLCDTAAAVRVDDPSFYAHSLLNLAAQTCRLKPAMGTIGVSV
jgi:beta-lactamase regulating signal transducer with metallopeptidase domain